MGLKQGDILLDPMMGSGTTLLEASLMGIRSIGIDISPFCRFMTQVKLDGLAIPLEPVKNSIKDSHIIFDYFTNSVSRFDKVNSKKQDLFSIEGIRANGGFERLPKEYSVSPIFDFLLLAYLDSAGYSERSQTKSHLEQFIAIIERYAFVVEKIQRSIINLEDELAKALALEGDARSLALDDNSIDGIIFSPPYSFAIDYLKNDLFHLNYLGVDTKKLQENMVGLHGLNYREKFRLYLDDMKTIISECSRVLRPGKMCTIIIGTNDKQLSTILREPIDRIRSLDEIMIEFGMVFDLKLIRKIERQITGIANTMRTESIILMQKGIS